MSHGQLLLELLVNLPRETALASLFVLDESDLRALAILLVADAHRSFSTCVTLRRDDPTGSETRNGNGS